MNQLSSENFFNSKPYGYIIAVAFILVLAIRSILNNQAMDA